MHDEWLARWRDGRIGFHEGQPNALLVRHLARLAGAQRVLVPLCGKAEDLAFLAAHGHQVVGIELAEQAVSGFFAERGLAPSVERRGPFAVYRAGAIAIFAGDVFAAGSELLGPVDGLYDRAALVALPPELRAAYVALLRRLLPPGAPGLVITLEYDQRVMSGPPFAVLEAELRTLYAGAAVELVEDRVAPSGGKCADARVTATERCFAIRSAPPVSVGRT